MQTSIDSPMVPPDVCRQSYSFKHLTLTHIALAKLTSAHGSSIINLKEKEVRSIAPPPRPPANCTPSITSRSSPSPSPSSPVLRQGGGPHYMSASVHRCGTIALNDFAVVLAKKRRINMVMRKATAKVIET
ncbi:hypothetical protein BDN70DRAFT_881351 [Pholiota conissans]|uniref:Uncharacterized protein n=1 Tax=Pholiota conissans TaxID=109636 RepID=A0A9P6CRR1_9AGAR|nr:hypothetical protein BDN70DRAFT_881351 [Pholiota conissans]